MNIAAVAPDVDLSQVSALGESLLTELDKLREFDPIHWSPATGAWLVTHHADIVRGFSGELPLSVNPARRTTFAVLSPGELQKRVPTLLTYMRMWIVSNDPPVHTRMRKLLVKAFSKKVVESVRPYVQDRVAQLLGDTAPNEPVEFVEGIARQLPGGVILKLMGLPQEYLPRLKSWANAFQAGLAARDQGVGSGGSGHDRDERDLPPGHRRAPRCSPRGSADVPHRGNRGWTVAVGGRNVGGVIPHSRRRSRHDPQLDDAWSGRPRPQPGELALHV